MKRTMVILLAAALCLLAGCTFSLGNFFQTYDHASRYTRGGGSLDEPVESLEINWTSGSVNIGYHDGDEVVIDEQAGQKLDRKTSLYYWLDDGTLRIQYAKSGFRFFFFPWRSTPAKDLTVLLPARTALEELSVNTVSADIWAEDIAANEAEMHTVSGDMDMANAAFSHTEAETVSGNIQTTLTGHGRSMEICSVSGSISAAAEMLEEFQADTTSGEVEFAAGTAPDSLAVDTVSGSVWLYLPEKEGYTLRLDSISGDLHSDLSFRADDERYIFGNGSHKYSVDTVSGDLFFEPLADISDWYD